MRGSRWYELSVFDRGVGGISPRSRKSGCSYTSVYVSRVELFANCIVVPRSIASCRSCFTTTAIYRLLPVALAPFIAMQVACALRQSGGST